MPADHGLTLGLRDDDHPQYYNTTRLNSWYSGKAPNAHTHLVADVTDIGTYYSAVGHSHVEADITDLGSYALDTHNHDGTYAPTHSHPYASDTHNHDGVYAPTHSHPYAASSHTHSYLPLTGGTITGAVYFPGIAYWGGDDYIQRSSTYFRMVIDNAEKFRADTSGASVYGRLDVTSYIYAASFQDSGYSSTSSPGWCVWGQSSGLYVTAAAPNGFTGLTYGGATVIAGNGSNQVYLGGMTSNSGSGTLRYIGTQIYYFASSERYKHDIEPADLDPDLLLEFNPVWFRFNDNPERRNLGWIAERLYDIGGEMLITRDQDGEIQANDEDAIGVLVVEKIKQLDRRIVALEERAA